MTAQTATLIAAVMAAIAGIFAAAVSSRTARHVAKETAKAESERELSTFLRGQVERTKEMIVESAMALQTLASCCQHVPWLAKTSMADIVERGSRAISRINYAMEELKAMNAVEPKKVADTSGLKFWFQNYTGYIALYHEQIDLGNIALSGRAKAPAQSAENLALEAVKEWQEHLDKLRVLTAEIQAASVR